MEQGGRSGIFGIQIDPHVEFMTGFGGLTDKNIQQGPFSVTPMDKEGTKDSDGDLTKHLRKPYAIGTILD